MAFSGGNFGKKGIANRPVGSRKSPTKGYSDFYRTTSGASMRQEENEAEKGKDAITKQYKGPGRTAYAKYNKAGMKNLKSSVHRDEEDDEGNDLRKSALKARLKKLRSK